jgi:hypothetical protein
MPVKCAEPHQISISDTQLTAAAPIQWDKRIRLSMRARTPFRGKADSLCSLRVLSVELCRKADAISRDFRRRETIFGLNLTNTHLLVARRPNEIFGAGHFRQRRRDTCSPRRRPRLAIERPPGGPSFSARAQNRGRSGKRALARCVGGLPLHFPPRHPDQPEKYSIQEFHDKSSEPSACN